MTTVRHWIPAVALAVLAVTTARLAVAETPTSKGRTLLMQTAFNPNLPGAGEAVRTFAKSIKRMSGGDLVIKVVEPGRVVPTPDMLDAVISGDLEAAFTWSGYAASKSAVFQLFGTVPFGPGPDDLSSWVLDGDGGRFHREAYDKLGVVGVPCGVQGPKGGGWFRSDLNTVADLKGARLRFGKLSGEVLTRLGGTQVPMPSGEFFYQLQQGKVDGGEMSTPAIDAALGFDKLGLPYYMPGWHQPSSLLDFLMRKDHWQALSVAERAQIETACRANMAWMLGRSSHLQAVALDKLRKAGVAIKTWSPALLDAFQHQTQIVLKELADQDPDFAAAWANLREFTAQSTAWHFLSKLP